LYLNAGVSNGFAINETNKLTEVFQFNERWVITEERALEDVRKYEQGLLFGLGVKYNRYSLEFRTESGTGIDLNRNLGSGTRRYFLLLGYRFN
jgi:molybdate-binding protein